MRKSRMTALGVALLVGASATLANGQGPSLGLAVAEPEPLALPQFDRSTAQLAQTVPYPDPAETAPFREEAPLPSDQAYQEPARTFSPQPNPATDTPQEASATELGGPYCDPCCLPQPAGPPEPWRLPQPCFLKQRGIVLGGWLQQGFTANAQVPADRFNGPVATNDRHAEWQVNQAWMFLNRPVDTSDGGWDLGGRIDMIYGSDARFGVNWGLENRINGENQPYGLVIPQLYAEVAYNRLSVKLGHFAGILSYEQVPAVANFFYSHSYAMAMTEPLLVTGALADYKLSDRVSIQAGFHRGWMMWEDLNNDADFMGGVRVALGERTAIRYALSIGPQDPVFGNQNRVANSLLLEQGLSEKLRYVLQSNFGVENNGDPRNHEDAEWYGLNNYLFYTMSPQWSAGMRFEWLRDDDGLFYGPGNVPGNGRAWAGGPGFSGDWFELTWGLNYRPCPNAVIRPEIRYDWYNGTRDVKGELPFDDGNKSYQLTVAADLIITF